VCCRTVRVPEGQLNFRPVQIGFERCLGSATAVCLERPSPFCHPERSERTCGAPFVCPAPTGPNPTNHHRILMETPTSPFVIPGFQEWSAEPQIAPRHAGTGRLRSPGFSVGTAGDPYLPLKRSPLLSLRAKQLRRAQNEDGEQGDIESGQHAIPFRGLLQSKTADHRRKQCCPGNEGIEQNGFVRSMCAFAYRTHSIQRRDSQGRGKIPVRTSACRCFLEMETQPRSHCCCAAKQCGRP
jgi:hypothetical protein